MDYDVVIATRNRPEALRISIPLILNQNRAPRKLIIVDASDDHEEIRQTVTKIVSDSQVALEILESVQRNSALQRNIGLEEVESPVVMFPDDDSLWWPGVAEAIMRIYERDENSDIGGVSADLAKSPPTQARLGINSENKMLFKDRFRQRISRFRGILNRRIGSDPMYILGYSFYASPTPYMAGCRMSFRTRMIRQKKFDANLGSSVGWAAYEDADASFRIMQDYLLVTAHNAKVCHYRFPSHRANGFQMGFINHFNRAYIICRYSSRNSPAREALKRFGYYKAAQYMTGIHSKFGSERLLGHLKALRLNNILLKTSAEKLTDRYLELCDKTLGHGLNNCQ